MGSGSLEVDCRKKVCVVVINVMVVTVEADSWGSYAIVMRILEIHGNRYSVGDLEQFSRMICKQNTTWQNKCDYLS